MSGNQVCAVLLLTGSLFQYTMDVGRMDSAEGRNGQLKYRVHAAGV